MVDDKADSGSLSIFGSSWAMFLLGILLVVASVNSATLVVRFVAMILVLMVFLRLWTAVGLWRLDLELSFDGDRCFPGDSFSLGFNVVNRKPLPLWIRLELSMPEALEKSVAGEQSSTSAGLVVSAKAETSLRPFEQRSGAWTFQATRRGVHQLGPATLVAGDILGLYRRERLLSFKNTLVVFPRLVPIVMPELPFLEYFGIHPAKGIIEDPAWYEGTREYSGNKPARHIHWKASARLNQLQEKIFQPTSHRKIYIILDGEEFSRVADRTGFETALELAASLASRYAETGASVALATDRLVRNYTTGLDLGRGPEQLGRILELLARCELEAGGQEFLASVRGSSIEGCGFIVISCSSAQSAIKYSSLLPRRKDRLLFISNESLSAALDTGYPALAFEDLFAKGEL